MKRILALSIGALLCVFTVLCLNTEEIRPRQSAPAKARNSSQEQNPAGYNGQEKVDQRAAGKIDLGKNVSQESTLNNEETTMASNKAAIAPNIGISLPNCEKVGALLNKLLADEFVLYIKSLNYHWNVRDVYFNTMHEFFKDLYEKQLTFSDDVAERARALGVVAFGTAQEFLKHSQLKEQPGIVPTTKEMLKNLLSDHEAIIRSMRIDAEKCLEYEDIGTNNFLTEMINKHEKIAWMLRASFEQK